MSSQENRDTYDSPENEDGKSILYNATDGFIPLGFSTPQASRYNPQQNRNYHTAQPYRCNFNRTNNRYNGVGYGQNNRDSYGGGGGNSNRNWRGNQRNQRFGNQRKREDIDIAEYFHPSMLEDPWENLISKTFSTTLQEDTIIPPVSSSKTYEQDLPGGGSSSGADD